MQSSVSPKGQITIPVEIRKMLGVKPKDKVSFEVEDGKVNLVPARFTLESVFGSVPPPTRTEDLEQLSSDVKEEQVQKTVDKLKHQQ